MSSWLRRALQNRRLVVRSSITAGAVAVLGIGFFAWLPALARTRIANQLQTRTGLEAEVSGVSLGLLSVSVDSIALRAAAANGPQIELRGMVLDAGALSLALRGARAVDAVAIDSLSVRVPLQAAESRALIDRVLARKGEGAQAQAREPRALPAVRIAKLAVAVDDEHGALLHVDGGAVHSDGTSTGVTVADVRIGGAPSAELVLGKLAARFERAAQGLVLSALTIGEARMWPGEPSAAQAGQATAGDTDEEEEAGPEDGLKPASGANSAPAAVAAVLPPIPQRPSLLKRIRAALPERSPASAAGSPASAVGAGASAAGAAAPAASGSAHRSLFERLAQGARIELAAGAVFAARDTPPVLDGLRVEATVRGDGALAFSGSGKAKGGGTVSWDLTARPELVQADGSVKLRALPLDLVAPYLPAVPWYEPERGRIEAELVVKTDPARGIAFSGEVALRDAALSHPRIAATPVHDIQVALHGSGRFLPLQDRLEIEDAELRLRGATASVRGAVEYNRDHYVFDIDADMPLTPCTEAVRSIPEDLLGDMALASWRGKIGGKLHVKLDSRALDKGELEIDPEDHCEFVAVPAMADLRRFQFPFTHTVLEPDGTEFEMETGPGTSEWTYIEDISPYFVHAVLVHEDAGFFSHHGFSEMHIRSALIRNLQEGRYVVGASTITMQLVKNVFLHREKTLARKIQEVLLTWWIERVMPKRDILELYLNVIEYGPSIYGIRSGAKHYFNRLPGQLSPAESVFLATILPNPKRYHAYFERGALTPSWTQQMRNMLIRLRERGAYSPEAYEYGLSELQNFKFVPEGTVVAPRIVPGEAAPLPYMQGYQQGEQPGWDDPDAAWDEGERRGNAPGGSTAFTSAPAVGHPRPSEPTAVPAGRPPPAGTRPGVTPKLGAPAAGAPLPAVGPPKRAAGVH